MSVNEVTSGVRDCASGRERGQPARASAGPRATRRCRACRAAAGALVVALTPSASACGSSPSPPAEADAAARADGAAPADATVDAVVLPDAFAPGYYGFAEHLNEAIALNTERQPLYHAATDGGTVGLSQLLISSERALLTTAEEFDGRALASHAEGIPIVAADFVSMAGVPAHDAPIAHHGFLSEEARSAAATALDPLRTVEPAEFQEGWTAELSADLVAYQLELPMEQDLGLLVDAEANQHHMEGVGIIVNDVPHIPFAEEYEAAMGR